MYQIFRETLSISGVLQKGEGILHQVWFFFFKKKDTIDQMIATNNGETVYVAYNWI